MMSCFNKDGFKVHPIYLFSGSFFLMILLFSQEALAHKVMVFAEADQNNIITSSKFFNGKPVKQGKITVFDEKKNKLLEGKTDDLGVFSFKIPERSALSIVLDAGSGHRASWEIPLSEIEPETSDDVVLKEKDRIENSPEQTHKEKQETAFIDMDEFEKLLDQRLKPLNTKLSRMEAAALKPNFSNIVGGVGYIVGLMGLWMFLKYRKRDETTC